MKIIEKVTIVSDGMVVEFGDATICYFSADTLYANRIELRGQTFLDYDPSFDEAGYSDSTTASDVDDIRLMHRN